MTFFKIFLFVCDKYTAGWGKKLINFVTLQAYQNFTAQNHFLLQQNNGNKTTKKFRNVQGQMEG